MSWEQEGPKLAGREPPGAAQRNRYFRGKLLTVADYRLEQQYHIERRRMLNRALHGWGVVTGFAVEAAEGALRISPGLAFDRHGRELVACAETILERDSDMFWLGGDTVALEPAAERLPDSEAAYLLSAHYAERGIDGVRIDDGFGEGACEANRICETVVFSLSRRPASAEPATRPDADDGAEDFDPCRIGKLSRLRGVDLDLHAPVPLALVTVRFDRSGAPAFTRVDAIDRRFARPTLAVPHETEPPNRRTGGGLLDIPVRIEPAPAPSGDTTAEGGKP